MTRHPASDLIEGIPSHPSAVVPVDEALGGDPALERTLVAGDHHTAFGLATVPTLTPSGSAGTTANGTTSETDGPRRTLIAVHAHEVEHGDILVGLTVPVDAILTSGDGNWFYGSGGTFIAIRSSWGTVDVWREVAAEGDEGAAADAAQAPPPSAANPDWANPHGIKRPLRAVPS